MSAPAVALPGRFEIILGDVVADLDAKLAEFGSR